MSRLHCWRSDPTAPGGGAETVGVTLGGAGRFAVDCLRQHLLTEQSVPSC